jgi:hypothetical protein
MWVALRSNRSADAKDHPNEAEEIGARFSVKVFEYLFFGSSKLDSGTREEGRELEMTGMTSSYDASDGENRNFFERECCIKEVKLARRKSIDVIRPGVELR